MEEKNKLPGAEEIYGVKFVVDKSLDKYSGRVLFPEELKRANEMLRNMKSWPPQFDHIFKK